MDETTATRELPLTHGTVNGCFGCGEANDAGLHLQFFIDEENRLLCRFQLPQRFQGPPGHAHGGIIATLLDEAMSKACRRKGVVAMTRHMSIDYRRPVPLRSELVLEGWTEGSAAKDDGRKYSCRAEVRDNAGQVLASGAGLFIAIPPELAGRLKALEAAGRSSNAP